MEVEIQSPQALEKQPKAPEFHGCPAFRSLVMSPALKEPVGAGPPTPPADLGSGASAPQSDTSGRGGCQAEHRERMGEVGTGLVGRAAQPETGMLQPPLGTARALG